MPCRGAIVPDAPSLPPSPGRWTPDGCRRLGLRMQRALVGAALGRAWGLRRPGGVQRPSDCDDSKIRAGDAGEMGEVRPDRVSTGGRRAGGTGSPRPGGPKAAVDGRSGRTGFPRAGRVMNTIQVRLDRVPTGGPRSSTAQGADGRPGQGHLVRSKRWGGQGCCAERLQSRPLGTGDGPCRV